MEEQTTSSEEKIKFLFNTTYKYKVLSQTYGGKTFYKIPVFKKNFDGQELRCNIPVRFAKCQPVPNGTVIRIKNAMEDWYINPKDKWNIVLTLVIFDYEILKTSDVVAQQAIETFNSLDVNDDELPF